MAAQYIPEQGDLVIVTFDPQAGHEQRGRRPALVVSKQPFNRAARMALVCPITNTNRNFPFHVAVPPNSSLTGYIMVEQIKSLDYRVRRLQFVEKLDSAALDDVLAKLDAIVY